MDLHLRMAGQDENIRWVRPGTDPALCKNAWIARWDPRDVFRDYGCEVAEETIAWFV
jgi:hypothetical protein